MYSLRVVRRARDAVTIVGEIARFAMENKRWWLVPVCIGVLLLLALVVLSASPVAPFIYALF